METEARPVSPQESPESLSEAVIEAVAEAEGVDPMDLRPSLYDVVDPDALEMLFEQSNRARASDLTVSFAYGPWTVHVGPEGTVTLNEHGQKFPDTETNR